MNAFFTQVLGILLRFNSQRRQKQAAFALISETLLLLLLMSIFVVDIAQAQRFRANPQRQQQRQQRLEARSVNRQGASAFLLSNKPGDWGVGHVSIPLDPENAPGPLTNRELCVASSDNRVLYPAISYESINPTVKELITEKPIMPAFVQDIVRAAIDNNVPSCHIYFLFRGSQPIQLTVGTNPPYTTTLVPQVDPASFQSSLSVWQNQYLTANIRSKFQLRSSNPPLVNNYLQSMLFNRLGLSPTSLAPSKPLWETSMPFDFLSTNPGLSSRVPYDAFFADRSLALSGIIPLSDSADAQTDSAQTALTDKLRSNPMPQPMDAGYAQSQIATPFDSTVLDAFLNNGAQTDISQSEQAKTSQAEPDKGKSAQEAVADALGSLLGNGQKSGEKKGNEANSEEAGSEAKSESIANEPQDSPQDRTQVNQQNKAALLKRFVDSGRLENMALHTPHDCVYIRFGSFNNFIWFQDWLASLNGATTNILASQSWNFHTNDKTQTQLALRQTELSKILGPTVIKDVAFVGADLFLEDGASMGVLFEATNSFLLNQSLSADRAKYQKDNPDSKEETIKIGKKKVKYLSTPDNRIRSFYVVDGMFHFVTNSRTLLEEFLATKAGENSLADCADFLANRARRPANNGDCVFLFAGEDFFHRLISPEYWVEILRRRRSSAEIQMAYMARLAAANEGLVNATLDVLADQGFLPASAVVHVDGSRLVVQENGTIVDSLRGVRGSFVPAADIKAKGMSDYELNVYNQCAVNFGKKWEKINPLCVGIKKKEKPNGILALAIDADIFPVSNKNLEMIQQYLGPSDAIQLAPIAGNWLSLQANLATARFFAGVREQLPLNYPTGLPLRDLLSDLLGPNAAFYLATTGDGGPLKWLQTLNVLTLVDGREFVIPGAQETQLAPSDVQCSFYSMQQEVFADVIPQFKYVPDKRPYQIRLTVSDAMKAPIGYVLNDVTYAANTRTSLCNLALLQTMTQQFGVAPENARAKAEQIFGGTLYSPLGGEYQLSSNAYPSSFWFDTNMGGYNARNIGWFKVRAPKGVIAHPWTWFRTLDAQLSVQDNEVRVHADLEMQTTK